jgi:septal ring factor EnvC (AmiA/AmiB activator)
MTKLLFNKTHSETMKNEGKILELLADMALKQDRMVEEFLGVKKDLNEVKKDLSNVKKDLNDVKGDLGNIKSEIGRINSELVKLNLQTSENTRAIFKLSDGIEQVVDHEKRILKLESIVLK